MMKRAWFYHRTAGWEKGAYPRLCRVDFRWIDRGEYFRINFGLLTRGDSVRGIG